MPAYHAILLCQRRAAYYFRHSVYRAGYSGEQARQEAVFLQRMAAQYYRDARLSLHGRDFTWSDCDYPTP